MRPSVAPARHAGSVVETTLSTRSRSILSGIWTCFVAFALGPVRVVVLVALVLVVVAGTWPPLVAVVVFIASGVLALFVGRLRDGLHRRLEGE